MGPWWLGGALPTVEGGGRAAGAEDRFRSEVGSGNERINFAEASNLGRGSRWAAEY